MMPVAESRKRNTFYNFLIPTLITFATIFLKFFEVRLFLSVLGDSYNGLQSMATQVLSYLNIIELGVGAAFIFHFYKPLAEHNELRVCAVFNGAKIIMRRIGYVFTILLFIAASCYPFFVKDVHVGTFFSLRVFFICTRVTVSDSQSKRVYSKTFGIVFDIGNSVCIDYSFLFRPVIRRNRSEYSVYGYFIL